MATRQKAQATVRDLTRWPLIRDAKVQTRQRKALRDFRSGISATQVVSKVKLQPESNSKIDARIDFYGQYIQLNEQVTLQNQDPVLNEAAARLGVSLNNMGEIKLNLNNLENLTAIA